MIVDNRIYRGAGHGATEIGHLRVPYENNSQRGWRELELVASGWGIAAAARELVQRRSGLNPADWALLRMAGGDPGQITAALVAEAASAGDSESRAILETARSAFAFALTQAIALLAPRRIVIGGGVSLIGEENWFDANSADR